MNEFQNAAHIPLDRVLEDQSVLHEADDSKILTSSVP